MIFAVLPYRPSIPVVDLQPWKVDLTPQVIVNTVLVVRLRFRGRPRRYRVLHRYDRRCAMGCLPFASCA